MQLWQSSKLCQSFISAPSTLVSPRSGDMIVKNEPLNFKNPERVIFFFCNFSPSDFYWWAFVLMQLCQSSKLWQSFISAPSTLVSPRSGDMIIKTMNRWILKTLKGWYFSPVILTLLYRKILRWKPAPKSVEKTKHYFQSKEFGTEPNSFFWGY